MTAEMPYDLRRNRSRMRGRGAIEVNGQYRVTVPDPDALDRLRTRNRIYDRTLQPREHFMGGEPHWDTIPTRVFKGVLYGTYGYGRRSEDYEGDSRKHPTGTRESTLRVRGTRAEGFNPPICEGPGE